MPGVKSSHKIIHLNNHYFSGTSLKVQTSALFHKFKILFYNCEFRYLNSLAPRILLFLEVTFLFSELHQFLVLPYHNLVVQATPNNLAEF